MIHVYAINNTDWWAGRSAEEVLTAYMAATGLDRNDATEGNNKFPRPLLESEMKTYSFADDEDEGIPQCTFREHLNSLIKQGVQFPCFFATTES